MKNRILMKVLGFCLLLGSCLMFPAKAFCSEPPLWPLDLDTRYLTSNFMEYRSGRFHAGIDLKTNTITGFAVRAVEDGYVQRIRATPFAYGRAIYVRGVSGKTYVYAHLARFNDTLRSRIDKVRKVSGDYRVRLEFKAGEVAVKRGEILGLSGESGTGGPHLHFEVRDEQQRPLNPHRQGFTVPDTLAPVFHTIRVIPMSVNTTINGQSEAMVIKAVDWAHSAQGLKDSLPPLDIVGPVAFSAKIVDQSDIKGHKLEPWLLTVTVDGETSYSCRNDVYSFSENSLQRLEWLSIPAQGEIPQIREHWLFNKAANTLSGRKGLANGLNCTLGKHMVEISAIDYFNNETKISFPLSVDQAVGDSKVGFDRNCSLASGKYVGWVPEPVRVVVQVDSTGEATHWLTPFGQGQEPGAGPFPPTILLEAAKGDPVLEPTILTNIPLDYSPEQVASSVSQGLLPVGKPFAYLAANWPIDAAVQVPVSVQQPMATGTRAYQWRNGQWKAGGLIITKKGNGISRFPLSTPGVYGFFLDEAPPVLAGGGQSITVSPNTDGIIHGISMPHWQSFAISVVDLGSGVAPATIKAFLDDKRFIVEPDLPRDQILIVLPDKTSLGYHVLTIEVADKVGNLATRVITIDVVP